MISAIKMTVNNLRDWLKETAWDRIYWSELRARARELAADGCSGVPDWMVWTCLEHDVHYRTHRRLDGTAIDKTTADMILRVRMQQGSAWGMFYWRAWARWSGVAWLPVTSRKAQTAWDAHIPPA